MAAKYCHVIIQPRIFRVHTIDGVADGHTERGTRAGFKDFEGWLAALVLLKKQQGYIVTVERNDSTK